MPSNRLHSDFMRAARIFEIGDTWVRNPMASLRQLKDAAKQMTTIRLHFEGIYKSADFRSAERAMHRVSDKLVHLLNVPSSAFRNNFEVNWKMATMLSHLNRHFEALQFVERAEAAMTPAIEAEKGLCVAHKKTSILLELARINRHGGFEQRALEVARLLDPERTENRVLLERAQAYTRQRQEPSAVAPP